MSDRTLAYQATGEVDHPVLANRVVRKVDLLHSVLLKHKIEHFFDSLTPELYVVVLNVQLNYAVVFVRSYRAQQVVKSIVL